ncbi:MAG: lysylphosphatidylglycerol synthase transmembrane domain-containing protein [bacterium]
MLNKKTIKTFLQILGPLIFIYILFQIDYSVLSGELRNINLSLLFFAFGLMILETIIRSFRWRIILSSLKLQVSIADSISLCWLGSFVGIITPGRLGEVIKVYFLKDKGCDSFRSLFSIIIDRAVDVMVLLFLSAMIALFFLKSIGVYVVITGVMLLTGIIFIFLLIDERSWVNKIFSKIIQKVVPIDLNNYSRFTFGKLWQGIKGTDKKDIIYFIFYLILSWLLYFYSRYVIALSLGLKLSFMDIVIVSVSIAIVSILPISVAGLGTREAAVIYIFVLFGLNKEIALLFSLLIFTINIISVSFGLIPYVKEMALINKAKKYESK